MPDELAATLEVLREVFLHKALELLIAIKIYRVPKLRFAMVQIIDAVEIQILLVPSKHSFPTADIYIGIGHSRYFLVSKSTATQIFDFKRVALTLTKFEPGSGSKECLCRKGYQKHQLHRRENCFAVISKTKDRLLEMISDLPISQLLGDFYFPRFGHTCWRPA